MKNDSLMVPKLFDYLWLLLLLAFIFVGILGWSVGKMYPDSKVSLPHEYNMIAPNDTLRGCTQVYWYKDTLRIVFKKTVGK